MAHNPTPTPAQQKPRRDWWTFDRSDRWGLAILLTAVVVATTMAAIVVPIQRWIAGDGIPVPFRSEVWLIIAVMRTIAAGDPFSTVNVRRLRILAAMLLLGPAITFFVATSIQGALLGDIPLGGLAYALTIDIPWAGFIAGLLLALLAEAFKAGSRLRDDVDGLI
jgi:LytS/YehU family sensor histidine kinase